MLDSEKLYILDVGARIRELREEKGWTIRDVAKRSGLPTFHLIAIEGGKHAATVDTLQSIATALGVTTSDLLNHSKDDAGFLMETMRQHPEMVAVFREQAKEIKERCEREAVAPAAVDAP